MDIDSKILRFYNKRGEKNIIIGSLIIPVLFIGLLITEKLEYSKNEISLFEFSTQKNTLISMANPLVIERPKAKKVQPIEPKVEQRIKMIITAYSSTPCQTDSTPFITASNTWVRNGIVANNFFPFGTKIKIPKYFGDKVFVIEDRMHWRKSNYQIDIWFPTKQEAINFGRKKEVYVEILEK